MRRRSHRLSWGAAVALSVAVVLTAGDTAVRGAPAATNADCPWVGSTLTPDQRADMVLTRMTLDDEIAMVHGIAGSGYIGAVAANPCLCIPQLTLEDGPGGVADGLYGVTQLPAPVTAAASWDVALMRTYGVTIGNEEKGKGADVALAPTVNIVRD